MLRPQIPLWLLLSLVFRVMNQRKVAFEIIYKTISDKAYTNLLMREKLKELEPIQRPFVTNLVNGVLKEFDYLVYRRNDGVIDQMVTFIQNEKALKDERQMLTEKNAAHEVRIAKLGKELNDLQATVEYQAEKIRQLENLKVYKMYQKVRKIVKRGN